MTVFNILNRHQVPCQNVLEIEIGCGKGKFLLARALAHPKVVFLGIDKAGRFLRRGIGRKEKRGLANLEFIKGDVREILKGEVGLASVDVFHIYFPDPWPKRRHRKRRLLQHDFFELLAQRLKKSGSIEIATDDSDYFEAIKQVVASTLEGWKIKESRGLRLFDPLIKTNYELKYEKEGRPLFYLSLSTAREETAV